METSHLEAHIFLVGVYISRSIGAVLLMGLWWLTECVPLAVTALFSLFLVPFAGISTGSKVAMNFFNDTVFVFMGGFIVAMAAERWQLHRRLSLRTLIWFGRRPTFLLLGMMLISFFISMFINDTATCMALLPNVTAVLERYEEEFGVEATHRYAIALLIGLSFSTLLGGCASLGTAPNLTLIFNLTSRFPKSPGLSFAKWLFINLPLSLVQILALWLFFAIFYRLKKPPGHHVSRSVDRFREDLRAMGPITMEQWVVGLDFVAMALLWVFRENIEFGPTAAIPGWINIWGDRRSAPSPLCPPLGRQRGGRPAVVRGGFAADSGSGGGAVVMWGRGAYLTDGTVAMLCSMILFMIPARNPVPLDALPVPLDDAAATGAAHTSTRETRSDPAGSAPGTPAQESLLPNAPSAAGPGAGGLDFPPMGTGMGMGMGMGMGALMRMKRRPTLLSPEEDMPPPPSAWYLPPSLTQDDLRMAILGAAGTGLPTMMVNPLASGSPLLVPLSPSPRHGAASGGGMEMTALPGRPSARPRPSVSLGGPVASPSPSPAPTPAAKEPALWQGHIMDWDTAKKLPWDILMLFGGGSVLALAFAESGLSEWLARSVAGLAAVPPLVIVLVVYLITIVLTAATSNTACAQMKEMLVPGLALTAFCLLTSWFWLFYMTPVIMGFDPTVFPEWAQ
ncbi:divalent anion:Na+ symporter [Paratrimastix pyriformis]|uniref:Divalent anion:Na+ symporter n=1 Tax=Paratrimastix pyriformis TaxID=342808 RepID=A0ABQ8U4T5_9EUKA|nr:divalent anion:Na+ symporter [Paratrimastix pyriformis]